MDSTGGWTVSRSKDRIAYGKNRAEMDQDLRLAIFGRAWRNASSLAWPHVWKSNHKRKGVTIGIHIDYFDSNPKYTFYTSGQIIQGPIPLGNPKTTERVKAILKELPPWFKG